MDESESSIMRDEMQSTDNGVGEGFGQWREQPHQGLGQLLDGT